MFVTVISWGSRYKRRSEMRGRKKLEGGVGQACKRKSARKVRGAHKGVAQRQERKGIKTDGKESSPRIWCMEHRMHRSRSCMNEQGSFTCLIISNIILKA